MSGREPGLFDVQSRFEEIRRADRPLVRLNQCVPWEEFRSRLETVRQREGKSKRGRRPYDVVLMFKTLILQSLYNLSDPELEFQIRDRFSFLEFLGLRLCDNVPDATTVWLFREQLKTAGLIDGLFRQFDTLLQQAGFTAKQGQIIDASIVPAPRQRSTSEQREQLKSGEVPQDWQANPHRLRQKDVDARWTRKNHVTHFGYKNHVSVDVEHGLIRQFAVTDAATHDSRAVPQVLDASNAGPEVYADAAYGTPEVLRRLACGGFEDRLAQQGRKNRPLTPEQRQRNRLLTRTRARVEHVFAAQWQLAQTLLVRTIGLARATVKIGLRNLTYNMRRYALLLQRITPPNPATPAAT